jgi:hypothetical protein
MNMSVMHREKPQSFIIPYHYGTQSDVHKYSLFPNYWLKL